LNQKINKEIAELKQNYLNALHQLSTDLEKQQQMASNSVENGQEASAGGLPPAPGTTGPSNLVEQPNEKSSEQGSNAETEEYTVDDISIVDIIDINSQNIFKFLLEKAILQIKRFGQIQQSAMSGIYGEMEQKANNSNRMFNLIVSQILDSPVKQKAHIKRKNQEKNGTQAQSSPTRDREEKWPSQLAENAKDDAHYALDDDQQQQVMDYERLIDKISEYQGVYNPDAQSLSQTMRNLYSLSRRHDIVQIIGKLKAQQEQVKDPKLTEQQKRTFENAINVISQEVCSPIAKVNCYYQQIKRMVPDFHGMSADDQKEHLQELLHALQNFESIENLYIDIQLINDFISDDQRDILTQFMCIVHIQNLFSEIQSDGLANGLHATIDEEAELQQQFDEDDGDDARENRPGARRENDLHNNDADGESDEDSQEEDNDEEN